MKANICRVAIEWPPVVNCDTCAKLTPQQEANANAEMVVELHPNNFMCWQEAPPGQASLSANRRHKLSRPLPSSEVAEGGRASMSVATDAHVYRHPDCRLCDAATWPAARPPG